jgi:hypothetical protein
VGEVGHPPCSFCRTRYFDLVALYDHLRDAHFSCFLCVRGDVRAAHL